MKTFTERRLELASKKFMEVRRTVLELRNPDGSELCTYADTLMDRASVIHVLVLYELRHQMIQADKGSLALVNMSLETPPTAFECQNCKKACDLVTGVFVLHLRHLCFECFTEAKLEEKREEKREQARAAKAERARERAYSRQLEFIHSQNADYQSPPMSICLVPSSHLIPLRFSEYEAEITCPKCVEIMQRMNAAREKRQASSQKSREKAEQLNLRLGKEVRGGLKLKEEFYVDQKTLISCRCCGFLMYRMRTPGTIDSKKVSAATLLNAMKICPRCVQDLATWNGLDSLLDVFLDSAKDAGVFKTASLRTDLLSKAPDENLSAGEIRAALSHIR